MNSRTEQKQRYYEKHKESIKQKSREYYQENREVTLKLVSLRRIRNLDSKMHRITKLLSSAKRRAKDNNLDFDINLDYLLELWTGHCEVSGVEFEYHKTDKRVNKNAPSLDRIDSDFGYIQGNVRFVTWHVNCAISEYGYETFVALCEAVIKNKEIRYGP